MADLRVPEINSVALAGRLTRDPELRQTQSGRSVANSAIAVDRYLGRDDSGDAKNDVSFFDITAWEKTGEILTDRFRKGSPIHVEGRLSQQKWQDRESGQQRSKVVIVVHRIQALSWPDKQQQEQAPPRAAAPAQAQTPMHDDEEIPF